MVFLAFICLAVALSAFVACRTKVKCPDDEEAGIGASYGYGLTQIIPVAGSARGAEVSIDRRARDEGGQHRFALDSSSQSGASWCSASPDFPHTRHERALALRYGNGNNAQPADNENDTRSQSDLSACSASPDFFPVLPDPRYDNASYDYDDGIDIVPDDDDNGDILLPPWEPHAQHSNTVRLKLYVVNIDEVNDEAELDITDAA